VSEDLVDAPGLDDGWSSSDVSELMRFAELYPEVPLHTLVNEVRHAGSAVPSGADDRSEIIGRMVRARLSEYKP
jgi:hypothetical protein